MRHFKKILSLLLTLVMVLAMGVTAFAAESGYTITITPNSDDTTTHTYEAYQIFAGDLATKEDGTKVLSNINWGVGVNGSALLTALKGSDKFGEKNPFAACTNAETVAEVLKGFDNDAATTQAFADLAAANTSETTSGTYANNAITGLTAGYYLVKDTNYTIGTDGKDGAYSRFLLGVVGDVTVNAKSEVPTVDKKIQDGEQKIEANTASIGDSIPYVVTSNVPDMTGYDKYFFVLKDTMSKGLTFNDDVAITVGNKELKKENGDFTVTETKNDDGTTDIEIVLNNFIQYKDQKDTAITVTYSATLNQDADRTQTGNVNEVKLQYSNNPNYDYKGENKPDEDEPFGETPKSTTKTYTTGIELTKVDGANQEKKLAGAKFQISGTAMKVVLVNKEMYKESANGTYYMLKDGTYTETAPTEATTDKYDSTETKYEKVTVVNKETKAEEITAIGYTDKNGVLTFEGLAAGTYEITELKAPDGYNMLKAPITVVISGQAAMEGCTWSATVKSGNDTLTSSVDGNMIKFSVQNNSGSTLPSTGGIGTTIFTVVGIILMVGAAILLITKRRMAGSENK